MRLRKDFLKIEEIKAFSYTYGKEKIEKNLMIPGERKGNCWALRRSTLVIAFIFSRKSSRSSAKRKDGKTRCWET